MTEAYGNIETIIAAMNAWGVENLFFNPGIDNVPLLETVAKYRAGGQPAPRGILCLDEFVAMTAAHGHHAATGRPQAVSVHSELGVLQIGGALHNAQWGRVPVVFFTENQGPPQRTDWRGEPFDQGTMVRSFVKWDHEINAGEDIAAVLDEAFRIATTEPTGPVYLNLPREALWREGKGQSSQLPAAKKQAISQPDDAALSRAAAVLLEAEDPLIITGFSGRNEAAVAELVALAEALGAPVLSSDIRMNFPSDHPLAALVSPSAGFGQSPLTEANVVLAIDYDMPYAAPPTVPRPGAKIIHIDIDTAKQGAPLWGKKPDIAITADSSRAIPALTRLIKEKLTPEKEAICRKRFRRLEAEHQKKADEWRSLAGSHAARKPITAHWLAHCINEAISEDTVIVNQTISPANIVAHLVKRTRPGTRLSCPGGCIGWAPGAALGVKLARPEKTVVSLMGDGAFVYGCPEASLWAASFYRAPFLGIIFNNQGYGAIKGLFRESYAVDNMGADITTPPDYAAIARACRAHGRTVEEPAEVLPAIREGLEQVAAGRPAVLDVRLEPV